MRLEMAYSTVDHELLALIAFETIGAQQSCHTDDTLFRSINRKIQKIDDVMEAFNLILYLLNLTLI